MSWEDRRDVWMCACVCGGNINSHIPKQEVNRICLELIREKIANDHIIQTHRGKYQENQGKEFKVVVFGAWYLGIRKG